MQFFLYFGLLCTNCVKTPFSKIAKGKNLEEIKFFGKFMAESQNLENTLNVAIK